MDTLIGALMGVAVLFGLIGLMLLANVQHKKHWGRLMDAETARFQKDCEARNVIIQTRGQQIPGVFTLQDQFWFYVVIVAVLFAIGAL